MASRVFVAGATGVVGRRSVAELVAAGHGVVANVRGADGARRMNELGAKAVTVDLFDETAVDAAIDGHDAVVNLATSIPAGLSAARPAAWKPNDRLRTEGAANLASAAARRSLRYVGESLTFPYVDRADAHIDESVDRTFYSGNASTQHAERAAHTVTDAGGVGVVLRFAMFFADDSAHTLEFRRFAQRGLFALPGAADAYFAFLHADDAARAVAAALDAPAGVFNVAEADPRTRGEHRDALARLLGRRVRALPAPLTGLGGKALASMARSQRISSAAFMAATGWEPRHSILDAW